MNKDANIPEDDWKKDWKSGTYAWKAPDHEPGTHPIEKGEVTWHQLRATRKGDRPREDITAEGRALEEGAE